MRRTISSVVGGLAALTTVGLVSFPAFAATMPTITNVGPVQAFKASPGAPDLEATLVSFSGLTVGATLDLQEEVNGKFMTPALLGTTI